MYLCTTVFLAGVGINPGKWYHIRPGQKVHGGGMGVDLEIKNIQNKFIFFVLFHVKDIEDTVYGM